MIYTPEQVEELLKQQRLNCLIAYTDYYAGSAEDFAPECVVRDIANAPFPVNFISSKTGASGSLPTFEETFKKQLYAAGDTQDFKRSGYITVNELWLRNFHKIAQGNDR